jgi:hypothetical protein
MQLYRPLPAAAQSMVFPAAAAAASATTLTLVTSDGEYAKLHCTALVGVPFAL